MVFDAIPLFATLLGSDEIAVDAVNYLSQCRELPTEDDLVENMKISRCVARRNQKLSRSIARKIVAAAKLSGTYLLDSSPTHLSDPRKVAFYLSELKFAPVEHLVVLTIDSDNSLIKRHEFSSGCVGSVQADPVTVFRCAIEDQASGIVFVHNHPSGSPRFSQADYNFANQLIKAGALLGIRILDSVLITRRGFRSMRTENYEMFNEKPLKE